MDHEDGPREYQVRPHWRRKRPIATNVLSRSITVKDSVVRDYNRRAQAGLKRTVWNSGCRAWYNNGRIVTAMYPGSVLHYKGKSKSNKSYVGDVLHLIANFPTQRPLRTFVAKILISVTLTIRIHFRISGMANSSGRETRGLIWHFI